MADLGDLPKHILKITDLTFALPDDFDGNIEDAILEFLAYRENHMKLKVPDMAQRYSTTEILLSQNGQYCACGAYGILHLNDKGEYVPDMDK